MGLLTAGYFPTTYWAKDYWNDRYWQDYAYVSGTIIKVFMFRDNGTPKTGLSPIVDIFVKALDGSSAGSAPSVTELSGGYYKFHHNVAQDTVIRVDSQDVLMSGAERYLDIGVITQYDDAIEDLADEIGGKWEITGNQMIMYKSDNVTEVRRFNLFDTDGNPATENVYSRERV